MFCVLLYQMQALLFESYMDYLFYATVFYALILGQFLNDLQWHYQIHIYTDDQVTLE